MMRAKQFQAALLSAALIAALAVPAGAANSSFSDVSDPTVAVNADVLRLMGVVDGTGGNQFQPAASLTRAQFCTMVVNFMQKGDQVPLHATRTIFSDVTAKHWGLGYVNLAASLTVGEGDQAAHLISGVGDGRFEPDAKITLAQATTILIRVLGYSSQQTGAVWPQSYMNLAKSIGLTDGISAGYYDPINRAQAAQLFVNALSCKNGGGQDYYASLGTASDDVVLLAVNVDSDDGRAQGAVRTSAGVYLPKAEHVAPAALQGRRGALVLNDKQEIVTFIPDDSTAATITLSGDAQPTYVKAGGGTQYTVSSGTLVYTADKTEGDTYVSAYSSLKSGSQITLFSERGKVVAIYAGGSTTAATDAVVVTGNATAAMFHQLTGGASGYTIQKNRQTITMGDIQPYDVVTYDAMTNTLMVSDLRLACVYEDASPSAKAPETVTVLGHTFDVLECAWDSIGEYSIGKNVTLLLTADGKVAGMTDTKTRSTAVGVVSGTGEAEMFLPNGGSVTLKSEKAMSDELVGQLVTLSSGARGRVSATRLSSSGSSGTFDVETMKLGDRTVTAGVRVFEKAGGAVAAIDLNGLDDRSISAGSIAAYHLNSSGMVDYIVLNAVTGDAYTYGILREGSQSGGSGEMSYTNRTVTVENTSGGLSTLVTGYSFKDGSFGGAVKGFGSVDGTPKAASVVALNEIKKVTPGSFFTSQGITYVNAGGKTYRVADDVECYKAATKEWFKQESGPDRLAACKAFSSDLTVYVDPVGEKVRIIVAN